MRRLRIILRLPLLARPESMSVIAKSIASILYGYNALTLAGALEPSWPQAQRLIICGQLLILCQEQGELQRLEAIDLWKMIFDLFEKHVDWWPMLREFVEALCLALRTFSEPS